MRERSLVAFTVLSQLAVGLFWALLLVDLGSRLGGAEAAALLRWQATVVVGVMAAGGAAAFLHLGTPRNAWRALLNVRGSWLSREILGAALFTAVAVAVAVLRWRDSGRDEGGAGYAAFALYAGCLLGAGLLLAMSGVYRLRTVPAWDSRLTTASFFLSAASLGSLATTLPLAWAGGAGPTPAALLALAFASLSVELWLEPLWARHRRAARAAVDSGLFPAPSTGASGTGPAGRATLLTTALAGSTVAWVGLAARAAGDAVPAPFVVAAVALSFVAALGATIVGRSAFFRSHARVGL